MKTYTINKQEENRDRIKSALLSVLIWSAILLFVFLYKLKPELDPEPEVVTTMLVNFGDNRNGNGIEEPADQPGSLAAATEEVTPEPVETAVPETKTIIKPEPQPETKKSEAKEKIITGNNSKVTVPKKRNQKLIIKKRQQVQVLLRTLKARELLLPIQKQETETEKERQLSEI